MDSQSILVVTLSPTVMKLLSENDLDLLTELQRQRLDVKRVSRPEGLVSVSSDRKKSTELIILASAVAAPIVATAIVRIIDAIGRNMRAVVTPCDLGQTSATAEHLETRPLSQDSKSSHSIRFSILGLNVELTDKFENKR
jgi:hypothetical protein